MKVKLTTYLFLLTAAFTCFGINPAHADDDMPMDQKSSPGSMGGMHDMMMPMGKATSHKGKMPMPNKSSRPSGMGSMGGGKDRMKMPIWHGSAKSGSMGMDEHGSHRGEGMSRMDHGNNMTMPGMDHSKMKMPMDHSKMSPPTKQQEKLPGTDHSKMNMPMD